MDIGSKFNTQARRIVIYLAFAMLRANFDIIHWILCMWFGHWNGYTSQIWAWIIHGNNRRLKIKLRSMDPNQAGDDGGGGTSIRLNYKFVAKVACIVAEQLDRWARGPNDLGGLDVGLRSARTTAAILDLADTILHELVHFVVPNHQERFRKKYHKGSDKWWKNVSFNPTCDDSREVALAFRKAVSFRYTLDNCSVLNHNGLGVMGEPCDLPKNHGALYDGALTVLNRL